MTHPRKHIFLIGLLALALLGMQAAQSAPWHDHEGHLADCVLCHLPFNDDAAPPSAAITLSAGHIRFCHCRSRPRPVSLPFTAFQSRAPPLNL